MKPDIWETDPTLKKIAAFHGHLDKCVQCRNHPFSLCKQGHRLIKEAYNEGHKNCEKR